jgi:hypothetical protein
MKSCTYTIDIWHSKISLMCVQVLFKSNQILDEGCKCGDGAKF